MASFTVTIENQGAVQAALDRYGERAEGAVYAGVLRTGYQVLDDARTRVPKVTSALAQSITLEEHAEDMEVDVFTNKEYAAIIEFGFDGPQKVHTHLRTITQAFGRRILARTITVDAHTRQVYRVAQPYMQPAAVLGDGLLHENIEAELGALTL